MQPRGGEQRSSCSSGQQLAVAVGNWAKAKAAIAAEVREQHCARAAREGEAELQAWLASASQQLEAAESEFQAAREAFQQADAERTSARDAFRADSKNADKSAAWHASVQRAQQAQEAMRGARERHARAQALCEMLQLQAAGRGLQLQGPLALSAAAQAPAAKRRRRNAPPESCPYCQHAYTVRDGLSSKVDAEGNRKHLRRCQCREKTPPCKNCPQCKAVPELMAVSDLADQSRLCQERYQCAICACKCPGAGKWVEADEESRKAFAERTGQRHGALSALGWAGVAGANHSSVITGAALSAGGGGLPWGDVGGSAAAAAGSAAAGAAATATGAAAAEPPPAAMAVAGAAAAAAAAAAGVEGGAGGGGSFLEGPCLSRGTSRPSARSLKRLPADIRSELEQAQQELSTADVLRGWRASPPSEAPPPAGPVDGPRPGARGAVGSSVAQQAQRDVHFHTCSHPHDECTSECCSAPHAPGVACGHDDHTHSHERHHHHHHNHNHNHSRSQDLDEHDQGSARQGAERDTLPTLAAMAVAAQQAQHGGGAGANGALLGLLGGDLAKASAVFQLAQQMFAAGPSGPSLPSSLAIPHGAGLSGVGLSAAMAQPSPPPELPAEVVTLVEEVFLHAAGQHGVQSVCAFLRNQRVTSLSDLEFMELSWLCDALQQPAGLPPLLLNKLLQLGRKRAARGAVATVPAAGSPTGSQAGEAAAGQQQQQQQQQQQPFATGGRTGQQQQQPFALGGYTGQQQQQQEQAPAPLGHIGKEEQQ